VEFPDLQERFAIGRNRKTRPNKELEQSAFIRKPRFALGFDT